jgi:hypothetical protein
MIIGMSVAAFTLLHVLISLVRIVAGCRVAANTGLLQSRFKVLGPGLIKLLKLQLNLTSRLVCSGFVMGPCRGCSLMSTCNALGTELPSSLHRD